MDLSFTDMHDYTEDFAHLVNPHSAHPRFQNPVQLMKMKMGEGTVFEVDELELDDGLEDDVEEVYDEDVLALFSFGGLDVGEKKKINTNADLVDVERHAHTDFPETEKLMKPLNQEGTVIHQGSELQVPERSKLYFHYAAICEGELEVFDTTMSRKYPAVMDLRKETTIPGLALALKSMCLSEVARFIIYPEMGFGKAGCPPRILPDVKIMYVIQVLQFIPEDKLNTLPYMTTDERNQLPFETIVKEAGRVRADGNRHYKDHSYGFAIKKWKRALSMLEDYPVTTEEDDKVRREYIWKLYSNLAQSYLKLKRPAQACSACKIGLKSVVENGLPKAKLLYRFAQAKLMLKDLDAALHLVSQALEIEPENAESLKLKAKIVADLEEGMKMFKNIFKSKGKTTGGNGKETEAQSAVKIQHIPDPEVKLPSDPLRSGFDMDDLVDDLAYCTPSQRELVEIDVQKAKTGSEKSPNRIRPVSLSNHLSNFFRGVAENGENINSADSGFVE
ncbi:Inactive peptidyl-prolyl cis-trans isomerase FKBP6 [Orchesella cincta]|uniref:peptidylprolyl isomerase n=1 Tax=Orchesella cincta TaxID=48709 RepID=A0A1D2ND14_ORCCI|nr:Inactive peptidyl-prolyl cis-trans isomerase FKBP6 [Orchesella cincta]